MNKYGFKGIEGFKELFIREDGKRKNRVILDMWKDKEFMAYIAKKPYRDALYGIQSMADLFFVCDYLVSVTSRGRFGIDINGVRYNNDVYSTDSGGICVDGDFRSYRYANHERGGQIFKMKIGKLYKHLVQSSEFGKHLPMSVILYLCEEMTTRWIAYSSSKCPAYELHVNDDFWRIYSHSECVGNFSSCMAGGENYHFYEDAVDAKAAYLTNNDGRVVSRCVIYTKATDPDGNVMRLAERQYSTDGDDILKRMLIYALIKGGHIDAYKKIGAGCHSPELWLDINDRPLDNPQFSIPCRLSSGDHVSYQDSFKWFDRESQEAYNYPEENSVECLSTTDEFYEGAWDSWHEEYTSSDLVEVYYNGRSYMCSEDCLDDFCWVEDRDEYHHYEDVTSCERCDGYVLNDDALYSELTNKYYCCDDCLWKDEKEWKEENWEWSEYDQEYVEEITEFNRWNGESYEECSISTDTLDALISYGRVEERDGEYYDKPENLEK